MISPRQEQALLDAAALGIDDDLRAAYRRLIDLIGEGMPPRDAVAAVLETFTGQYAQTLADGLSAILERSVGSASVLAMKVGEVSLSSRLYAEARDVSVAVQTIVTRHAAGWQDARALTLELYEGYGFRADEPLKISPRNPRLPQYLRSELLTDPGLAGELSRHFTEVHVSKLKTPALRAAYLEYLDEIKAGRGQVVLERRLDVAFHEQMRYRANRIAQTELHRAYAERQAVEIMEDEDVGFVQIRMSQTHPKTDICDYYASVDRYGLGKGVYPKALAPRPGFHPFCRCIAVPRTNIKPGTKWRERPEAAQSWLRQQGLNEGAAVMGSRARRDQVLKGADPTEVWNSRIAAQQYRVGPLGEVPREGWVAQRLGSYPEASRVSRMTLDDFWSGAAGAEEFAIARLSKDDMQALGASSSTVWLSRISMDAHKAKHPEIGVDAYRKIPEILASGQVWRVPGEPERLVFLKVGDVVYRAAVKRTSDGRKNYLLTLFRSTKAKPPKGAVRVR